MEILLRVRVYLSSYLPNHPECNLIKAVESVNFQGNEINSLWVGWCILLKLHWRNLKQKINFENQRQQENISCSSRLGFQSFIMYFRSMCHLCIPWKRQEVFPFFRRFKNLTKAYNRTISHGTLRDLSCTSISGIWSEWTPSAIQSITQILAVCTLLPPFSFKIPVSLMKPCLLQLKKSLHFFT